MASNSVGSPLERTPSLLSRTFSRAKSIPDDLASSPSHQQDNVFSSAFSAALVSDEGASPMYEDGIAPTQSRAFNSRLADLHELDESLVVKESSTKDLESQTIAGSTVKQDKPHGFFSHAESVRQTRIAAVRYFVGSIVLMAVLLMGLLSIYWGSYFNRTKYYNRVHFAVYNFDDDSDALVGPAFKTIASEYATQIGSIQLDFLDGQSVNYDYQTIYDIVDDQKTWGAYIVSRNASTNYRAALENPSSSSSYNGSNAIEFAYGQARDFQVYAAIIPWVLELNEVFTREFSRARILDLGVNSSDVLQDLSQNAPQVVSVPASVEMNNMRPYDDPIFTAVMQVGLIYLIIISFFQFNFFQPLHMKFAPMLKRTHYIIYRYLASWLAYFLLSLFYSLISLAFQVDFTLKYGRAGFFIFWMINFIGMVAVGGASENVALLAIATYPPLLGFWLIFIVISNVSVAFFSIPLEPAFYKYGYAFPIKNVCDALKTIFFGTKNTMGLNIGVLFAWIAVNTALFPFCMWASGYLLRRKREKAAAAAAEKQASEAMKN
ncbi:uncharacterized protein V1516DRAFT_667720 [Lipomyces oligophaga]|uniref:uncharacterized protein n=1 Tax=Lipomyces oligophaga TaxID=45792 RepID=UPI0034CD6C99